MPMVIINTKWPHSDAEAVGKAYLEVMKKYPVDKSLYKPIVASCVKATMKGFKALAVDDVKEGKLQETLDLVTRRMLMFGNLVKTLKYEIDVYMSGVEAMPMIGLRMPE
ncbi:MAG: hypothetical protein ACFFDF_02735 [Candidatus Odinarchaeota archaeon]